MVQEKTWLALNGTVISFPLQCIILQEQSLTDTGVFSFNQFVKSGNERMDRLRYLWDGL